MTTESNLVPLNMKPAEELEWIDISAETSRWYCYADGVKLEVHDPLELNIKAKSTGDTHRIKCKDGRSVYVAAGWLAIEWDGGYQF